MGFQVLPAGFLGLATGPASQDRRLHDVISNPVFVTAGASTDPPTFWDKTLRIYYTSPEQLKHRP